MKIVYIANIRIPTEKAHGIQITEMCRNFSLSDSGGNEVELVVPRRFNFIKENPFDHYGIERNFKITKLPCIDLIPMGLGKFGFLVQTVSFLISAKIYLFFKKFDVLYTREQFVGLFFKDFILEMHSMPETVTKFNKKIWKKAGALVVLTSFIKKMLIENGVSDKILIAPDGINLAVFDINISREEARKKVGLPQDKKILLYTGRFNTMGMDKGLSDILRSLNNLDGSVLFLAVGGSDEDVVSYEKMAESLSVKEKSKFLGYCSQSKLAIYQKAADCLLMPFPFNRHFAYYMSPLKMFEYMASGRPIVASDLPSIRDVLNESNAVLVKPDDASSLAEGVRSVLLSKELGDKISKQAFSDVSKYTWQKRAGNILSFVKNNLQIR
jgi:glycosyltransferase involved in cell wall biosynthesis